MSNPLEKFFERIFVINLDERPEKWRAARQELHMLGVQNYERVAAIKPRLEDLEPSHYSAMKIDQYATSREGYLSGACGCKLSHLKAIGQAKAQGLQRILILEDDAVFKPGAVVSFGKAIRKLPDDWHMLYFGGQHILSPRWFRRRLRRIRACFTTHAYGLNMRHADLVLDSALRSGREIDVFYAEHIHPLRRSFAVHPSLVTQRPGHSDILGTEMDYDCVVN